MSLSKYPKKLDMFQTKKDAKFSGDPEGDVVLAEDINVLQDAISAIENSLGVSPQGTKTTVGERITLLEGSSSLRVPSFLIYLGRPSLINESETLLEAMGHFAKYDHVVLGNDAMDPSDPDHVDTITIIEGVRSSKDIKFYGHIDTGVNTINLSVAELQNQIQSWASMGMTGIYCANFGFESRVDRERQNAILDSIHQHGLVAILNAADPEQVFTDVYHETMNPSWLKPQTQPGDVYHYNRYALDTSRPGVYESNVMTEIIMLIKLYEYRVEQGIRIFGTPLIESTVPQEQAQEYYDYAHVSALVTSLDAFHPVTEGYGALTNYAPTYDWVPIAGSWYMTSPRVEYDDYGIECVRETPFGRIILNTKEHTYRYEGIYIPYSLLKIAANTIEGNLIKDNTIEDIKIKSYAGNRLIAAINADITPGSRINPSKIMDLSYGDLTGDIPTSALSLNVINALHANIGHAKISSAVIGDLTAGHITAGTIDAGRISGSVIHAIQLYAEQMQVGSAVIDQAVIGDLHADKITAGDITAERLQAAVVEAINLSAQQADIKNLNADNITAGNIKAERIQAEVIQAMNLYAENMVAGSAQIDVAVIGDLTAGHIRASVFEAINGHADSFTINSAKIGELEAGNIKSAVIEAINLNAQIATIDSAVIGDLSASKITAGTLDADIIKGSVITAINGSFEELTVDNAKIGDLQAEKITTGSLRADVMQSNVVDAINLYAQTAVIGDAVIESAAIGNLNARHIEASVIDAINLYSKSAVIDKATIDAAAIKALTADHIKASVIEALEANIGIAKIDSALIQSLTAEHIQGAVIKALEANIGTATINEALINSLSADKITGGQIKADVLTANVVKAINSEFQTTVIEEAKIGDLNAQKITSGDISTALLTANVVKAINAELQTAVIDQAKIGDLDAKKITAGDISADRMTANIVSAVNAYVAKMVAGEAVINSAAISTLSAEHMQAKVLSAINASIETINAQRVVIDKAKIGKLDADNIEANAIKAQHITAGEVTADAIAADAILTRHIAAGQVTATEILAGAITTEKLDVDAVTAGKIAADAIEATHIKAGAVTADEIAADAVTTDKIMAGAITALEIAADAVTTDKIMAGAITALKIAAEAITADKIQALAIEAGHLSAGSVKTDALDANAVTAGKIAADAVTANKIKAGEIAAGHIAAAAIESGHIKAGSIQTTHIDTMGLNANVIKTGFLNAKHIAFESLSGDHIKSSTIETKHLVAGQIDGSVIRADSLHGAKIIAGTLSAGNLTAGSITSVEIAAKTIQTRNLAAGAVDASVLRAGTISAEHISTIGLDANQIEVFGNDGQVLIGDGFVKVDGLDVGVIQSDNLVGNGLFLTASSGFGHLRDNPTGEAILGNQAKIEGAHQLWRIDVTTGDHLAIDTGGTKPVDVVIDSTYEYLYVTLQGDDKVAQIQVSQGTQATRTGAELMTGKGPGRALYTGEKLMDHKHFFVLNTDPKDVNIPDSLTIIDAPPTSINQTLYVHHMIPLGNTPYDVALRMIMEPTHLAPGKENPHPGHKMYTYITQADQGDIAVLDMSHVDSRYWKVTHNIPIGAHMTDNYHGGLEGRFGIGAAVGGDSSSQYSDAEAESMAGHGHAHGGYGTSDGSIREYSPHGIALSADKNHIYVTDYANGHLLVIDVRGKAPYNNLTGSRVTGNLGVNGIPPENQGASGGGTDDGGTETMPDDGSHEPHMHAMAEKPAEEPDENEMMFSIQAGGHAGHGIDDSEPVTVPGMTGVITQEMQTTNYVRYRIKVGDSPERIEVIGGKVFVTLEGGSSVAVIDEQAILNEINLDYEYYGPRWNEFTDFRALPYWHPRLIEVGAKPTEMTVSPDKQSLFVTVNGQNQIAQIDIATEAVLKRFNTGPNPKGLKISPDGQHIYVVNHGGSGNLSFVYPKGAYIGDAYLGLEGGIEYQGAEHWVPNRSNWVYDAQDNSRVTSASMIEFHINEPFLNEGGFARMASHGIEPQVSTLEQDIYNVTNYSNGDNVAIAMEEQLKQDASLIRFWPKNQWLQEEGVRNITLYAKTDEFLVRDAEDNRIFYPSKQWIDNPERPVILVGLAGDYIEVSENNYFITYGEGARIIFDEVIPGDQMVYSSAYYYKEVANPAQYVVHYEDDTETSATGTTYGGSHITFAENYLPQGVQVKADYTFKHNRHFRSHNGSVLIATENSSSENFHVQFEVDEFVPKFITYDNQQTEAFNYWPIEVPAVTNAAYTGVEYSGMTNRAGAGTVSASVTPTSGMLEAIIDGKEPMTDGEELDGHMHMMHAYGEEVVFPAGLQHVVIDLGKTYMVTDIHITHAFHKNRQYHKTKTEVSQDGIHWSTIYDSAVSGEYIESEYMAGHGMTHYGKHHVIRPQPVRYVRDWANGYTEWATTSTDVSTWNQDTLVGSFTANHWTEIKVFGDWEFEKEFSRNYTSEMLNLDPRNETLSFQRGGITVTGGDKVTNIGGDNEQDVTRLVDKNLLSRSYFSKGNGAAVVTIDLGEVKKVDTVRVFRYFNDYRIHSGVLTEISADGTTWTTIYNSAVDGEYEESAKGRIIPLGAITNVRYIRDRATNWTATLRTGTVLTGNEIRWIGIHAYLDYNAAYPYVYPYGSELEGQNLASNGQGIVTTEVSRAFSAIDIKIDFTSWWYMTYIVGPEFGQIDVEMPTVMGGSHALFEDAPYLNKVAHRHIMSWPSSENVKADAGQNIKAGTHRAVIRQKSGKVSIDRYRFEDYQYLYMNSTEIPKGSATNFVRHKIQPEVAKWYIGRGNQATQGAYDSPNINIDTGKPDGSVSIKYRFRVKTRLNPRGLREERGVAYITSAIFETGRLSSHWRMSQTQDSFPGNRIQRWDPNQPHKTGIQSDHIANGAIRGTKLMPHSVMDHHISSYARIEESKLNLKHPTHRHGHFMNMTAPDGSTFSVWHDNKNFLDSIHGWGSSGTQNSVARADHTHSMFMNDIMVHGNVSAMHAMSEDGNHTWATFNGVEVVGLKGSLDGHMAATDLHFSAAERTKLTGIATGATKVEGSTNGNILINGVVSPVYAHPATAGNKHIPTGGAIGNFLKYSASGTAAWNNIAWDDVMSKPITFTPPIANATDLGGVKAGTGISIAADGTISWSHPTTAGNKHIPAGGATGQSLKWTADGTAGWGAVSWTEVTGKPTNFSYTGHTHTAANITDLNTVLNNYATKQDLSAAGEVKLATENVFTKTNTFTNTGVALRIQPSAAVVDNTVLMQINGFNGANLVSIAKATDPATSAAIAKMVINGDLEVTGSTIQKSTQQVEGDMNVTGNLNITGDTSLGDDASDQVRVKGQLILDGPLRQKGKSIEIGKVMVYGTGGDLNFKSDSTSYEFIISHYFTFQQGEDNVFQVPETGVERRYRLVIGYSTEGDASGAKLKIGSYGGGDIAAFDLPQVWGASDGTVRHMRTPEFTTSYTGHTTFWAQSAGVGKGLTIKSIEVVGYDYFA